MGKPILDLYTKVLKMRFLNEEISELLLGEILFII